MKKVTTNITFGQILFILFTFCFASLMFFYLGAKFGPQILEISTAPANSRESILPDESIALEIQELLRTKKHDFVFQDALENKVTLNDGGEDKSKSKISATETDAPNVTKQILEDLKKSQSLKTPEVETVDKTQKPTLAVAKPTTVTTPVEKPTVKVVEPKPKVVVAPDLKPDEPDATVNDESTDESVEQIPVSRYRLQLGSYSDIKKAKTAAELWQKRGYTATVVKAVIPGKGNWFRVRIGGYGDMTEAMNAQRLIMRKYRQSVSVVNLK